MTSLSPFLVLCARAEARAALFRAGLFDLGEALAPLEAYATASGLADEIGGDAVSAILKAAFQLDDEGPS